MAGRKGREAGKKKNCYPKKDVFRIKLCHMVQEEGEARNRNEQWERYVKSIAANRYPLPVKGASGRWERSALNTE